MPKISKKVLEEIEDAADALEGQTRKYGVKVDDYGLCDTCTNLRLVKTEFGNNYTECQVVYVGEVNYRPRKEDPVTECSNYWHKNWKTFKELADKAILIDPNKKRPGFNR